jgi:hypothetical protein
MPGGPFAWRSVRAAKRRTFGIYIRRAQGGGNGSMKHNIRHSHKSLMQGEVLDIARFGMAARSEVLAWRTWRH